MVRKRMPKHPLTIAKVAIIFQRKGAMPIVRNSFMQISKLPNVKGRISYISSKARQENLYAVYETTDRKFWKELAKCNQEEFRESGTKGNCIEARELIIALPESFVDYEPDKLLKLFTEHFKQNYGVECISALHHNKRKTNYHIHLIFSERKLLDEPVKKIATRNMFYDENGKHVRTKKEILDEAGLLRKGCKIIHKGEVYERNLFTIKDSRFKAEYSDYQLAVAKWEQQTGNKAEPDSLKAKLQRKTQEVKERENNRQSHHYRSDRGGR